MPHYYAHRVFGSLVWNAFPTTIRQQLDGQNAGFQLGLYGPDPLFFYSLNQRNQFVVLGHAQHNEPPRIVLERYRGQLSQPQAAGYALGWFSHYLLDEVCHPVVLANCHGPITHAILELALDRRLHRQYPLDPEPRYDDDSFAAAAIGCPGLTGPGFGRALKNFYRFSFTTATVGHYGGRSDVTSLLEVRLRSSVERCVHFSELLLDALSGDAPLDFLPELDFQGKRIAKPHPIW